MNNEDEYWNSCILCVSLSFTFRGYIGGHVLKKKTNDKKAFTI